jgi:hypothetical protein
VDKDETTVHVKLSFSNEGEMEISSDTGKLREFVSSSLT